MNPISIFKSKFVQSLLLKWLRQGVMALGGILVAKGYLQGSEMAGVEGSLFCLGSVALETLDNFVVNKSLQVTAIQGAVPASVSVLKPAAAQVTMAPIPNPGETK